MVLYPGPGEVSSSRANEGPRRAAARQVARRYICAMQITPTGAALGADVTGVDLRQLDPKTTEAIHQAWLAHEVLLFRGQHLTDDDLIAFSRRFGKIGRAHV